MLISRCTTTHIVMLQKLKGCRHLAQNAQKCTAFKIKFKNFSKGNAPRLLFSIWPISRPQTLCSHSPYNETFDHASANTPVCRRLVGIPSSSVETMSFSSGRCRVSLRVAAVTLHDAVAQSLTPLFRRQRRFVPLSGSPIYNKIKYK